MTVTLNSDGLRSLLSTSSNIDVEKLGKAVFDEGIKRGLWDDAGKLLVKINDDGTIEFPATPSIEDPATNRADPAAVAVRLTDWVENGVNLQLLAAIIQETNLEARETARQDRQQARDMDISQQKDAANKIRSSALIGFVSTMVTSSFQVAASLYSIKSAVNSFKVSNTATQAADAKVAQATGMRAQAEIELAAAATLNPGTVAPDVKLSQAAKLRAEAKLELEDAAALRAGAMAPPPAAAMAARPRANAAPTQAAALQAQARLDAAAAASTRAPAAPPVGAAQTAPGGMTAKMSNAAPDPLEAPATAMTPAEVQAQASALEASAAAKNTSAARLEGEVQQARALETSAARNEAAANRLDGEAHRITERGRAEATHMDRLSEARKVIIAETGKVLGAMGNTIAAEEEAKKNEILAKASMYRTRAENEGDFMRAYQDNFAKVTEKLAAMMQSEIDSLKGMFRG